MWSPWAALRKRDATLTSNSVSESVTDDWIDSATADGAPWNEEFSDSSTVPQHPDQSIK